MSEEYDDCQAVENILWEAIVPNLIYLDDSKESLDLKRNTYAVKLEDIEYIPIRLDFARTYNNDNIYVGADLLTFDYKKELNASYRVYLRESS